MGQNKVCLWWKQYDPWCSLWYQNKSTYKHTKIYIFFIYTNINFFFLYINLFNTLNLNIYNKNFFLKKNKKKNINLNLGFITFFLIGCIVIEFLFLDYNNLLGNLDIFHEATNLVPLINYINNKTFWLSNFYEYGFWGNNLGLLSYNIFGVQSIGLIRLFEVSHILFVKIFLILICNKITFLTELTQKKAIFFFVF